MVNIVQQKNEADLEKLLKSDTIWMCGECLSCKTIGLQTHQVAVEPLLDKLGIAYYPEKKYMGLDGEDIGLPEKPQVLRCS